MILLSLQDYINNLVENDGNNRSLMLDKITSYNDFLQTTIKDTIDQNLLTKETIAYINNLEEGIYSKNIGYLTGMEIEFTDIGIDYIGAVRPYYSNLSKNLLIDKLSKKITYLKNISWFDRTFRFNKILKNNNYGT